MTRTRISTTVDGDRLEACRRRHGGTDSEVVDAALAALLREIAGRRELEALRSAPYDDDPELEWPAPPGPDLPYDGEVPVEVVELARQRRASYDP